MEKTPFWHPKGFGAMGASIRAGADTMVPARRICNLLKAIAEEQVRIDDQALGVAAVELKQIGVQTV